jgi:hypothetical protein
MKILRKFFDSSKISASASSESGGGSAIKPEQMLNDSEGLNDSCQKANYSLVFIVSTEFDLSHIYKEDQSYKILQKNF